MTPVSGFAPSELAGKPEEIQKWAVDEMIATAYAAKNIGIDVRSLWALRFGNSGTLSADLRRTGGSQFEGQGTVDPIFDEYDKCGVKLALEVHPTEIAFDYWTTRNCLKRLIIVRLSGSISTRPTCFGKMLILLCSAVILWIVFIMSKRCQIEL